MTLNFANGWKTTITESISDAATEVDVADTDGIPARPFRAILPAFGSDTDEIIEVTGLSGSTITFSRAVEPVADGTQVASAHTDGATIAFVLTSGSLSVVVPAASRAGSLVYAYRNLR